MKEQNEKDKVKEKKPRKKLNSEKRFYLITALGCAAALVAIVAVAIAVSGGEPIDDNQASGGGSSVETPLPDSSNTGANGDVGDGGEQVGGSTDGMAMPLETVTVLNDYGFYHNTTLNSYYEHTGIDFTAAVGANVLAVDAGTIESIYKDDLLLGTEITVDHGEGIKSVYRFVTEAEGLTVGQTVNKGDIIATVAEANGNEYKDGAHLHFEITKDGAKVDPASYLTLEEK
jgi:murein DD-endopeptidase MepM/ murein hydrolase activator NlpD